MYYTASSLIPGATYQFMLSARNSIGNSQNSAVLIAIAAVRPGVSSIPVTTEHNNFITISWNPPVTNSWVAYGSAINAFVVNILQADGITWTQEPTNCLSTNPSIFAAAQCTIPTTVLMAAPFNLGYG